jgi:pimeloyl-ACP methyl ester carboxylesterase
VFAHANGFPPGTYGKLLNELSASFRVSAFAARPLWPGSHPDQITSWYDLSDDLRRALAERGSPAAIGVGHSLGGALSVLAAVNRPRLFRGLVLIDPVVFSGVRALFWGTFKSLGFGHRLPLIRSARRRRERFPDLDSVRAAYRDKAVFSSWEPEVLEDYIRAGFREAGDGVELRYPKNWEARIFELTPASVWRELREIDLPVLALRGGRSDTFLAGAARRLGEVLPRAEVVELPERSHFLPMEDPEAVSGLIVSWAEAARLLQ